MRVLWTPKAREQLDLYCCDENSHFIKSKRFQKHCQLKFCSYFQMNNGTFVHQFDWLHDLSHPTEYLRVLAIMKLYPNHSDIDDWCLNELDKDKPTRLRILVEI